MATNRSFTEYIKNHFDNELYNALREYLEEADPSVLDLRLETISNVGSIEPDYETEVKFVDVGDLPGSHIEFDVVMEVPLIVYDADQYHNDKSEYTFQWFTCKCEGDLASDLTDMVVTDVEPYFGRDRKGKPMSDSLVRIISREQLDDVATDFLRRYYPEALKEPVWVNPAELAQRMGLNVIRQRITKDMSVFGQVYFRDSTATVYDAEHNVEEEIDAPRGTVLVDPNVFFQRNLGAYNNTIIHECVHWDLHQKAFMLERLFNEDVSQIRCKVVGGIVGEKDDATKWMEWQANALAPRIQMPYEMFKKRADELISEYRRILNAYDLIDVIGPVIDQLSLDFAVSRTAAKIRMVDIGYDVARGAFNYVDGHYVRPHKTTTGKMQNDETFSVTVADIACEMMLKPQLKEMADKGVYLYVDSHLVLNKRKYIEEDSFGKPQLTHYARNHMEECCVVFRLSIQSAVGERYHTECFLNRDEASQIKFRAEYVDKDKEPAELISGYNSDILEIAERLPGSFSGALDELIKWCSMTEEELAGEAAVSAKTIQRLRNSEPNDIKMETIIKLCIGMSLPPILSERLLQAAGKSFMMTELHLMYHFLLTSCYHMSLTECDQLLYEQGLPLLCNEDKKFFENEPDI